MLGSVYANVGFIFLLSDFSHLYDNLDLKISPTNPLITANLASVLSKAADINSI